MTTPSYGFRYDTFDIEWHWGRWWGAFHTFYGGKPVDRIYLVIGIGPLTINLHFTNND